MKTVVATLAVLAIFEGAFAKSVIDGATILGLDQTRIFEDEVLQIIQELKDKAKEVDPIDGLNATIEYQEYRVKLGNIYFKGFSDFEVTDLKISVSRRIEATIRLPHLALRAGPFEASTPHGNFFARCPNYFESFGGTLSFKASLDLTPIRIHKLSFSLKLDKTYVELNGINDDPKLTKKLTTEANIFLGITINDPKWQKSVAPELEDIINHIINSILG